MRWTFKRKAEAIEKVRMAPDALRQSTLDALLSAHGITEDEWQSWLRAFDAAGKAGLKVMNLRGVPDVR